MVMAKTSVAILIKKYRKINRVRQDDLAKHCGWSRSFVQRLENGSRFPDPDTMIALIAFLKIPISEVFEAYDKLPDSDFLAAKTSRELVKSIIASTFGSESNAVFENSVKFAVPPYLQSAIEGTGGSYRSTVIDALESQLFGRDELAKRILKRLFDSTDDYTIKHTMTDIFSGLSVIETGTVHRRTPENRVLVELAQHMAVGATPDGQHGDPSWDGPYIPWPLVSSIREIVDRLKRTKQHARDAAKINAWIPRNLQDIDISPEKFDFMHFNFIDSFAPEADDAISEFEKTEDALKRTEIGISYAVRYDRIYPSILHAWPYIYDLRDTYKILMELAKLQPVDSYPDATPELLERIRSAVKTADDSWRQ